MLFPSLLGTAALAQAPQLAVAKSGNDALLSVTGGTAPFDYYRSISPTMTSGATILATGQGVTWTDAGALTDGFPLVFYQVGDANKPSIAITSPAPGSSTAQAKVVVSGTQSSAVRAYVNGLVASLGAGTFTTSSGGTPNVPLAEGLNVLTAIAYDASDNAALTQADLTKLGNNSDVPSITIAVSGSTGSDPVISYVPRPLFTVQYSDGDGIDTSRVFLNLNGEAVVPDSLDASQATYQPPSDLQPGMSFFSVSVADSAGDAFRVATKTQVLAVRGPEVTSINPEKAAIGASVTITGQGFSTVASENVVTLDGASGFTVPSAYMGSCAFDQVTFTIPPGAYTGRLAVTVNGRKSNEDTNLTVVHASGRQNIGGLTVNNAAVLTGNDLPILFTDRGTSDHLFQCEKDGSVVDLGFAVNDPSGLGTDSSGNNYTGQSTTGGSGQVAKYEIGVGLSTYLSDSRVPGESSSALYGVAATGPGTGPTLYVLDNANLKLKRVNPTKTITVLSTSLPGPANPGSAVLDSSLQTLYMSSTTAVRKFTLASPGTPGTVRSSYGSPRALAITDDDRLVVPRVGAGVKRVSALDPSNPSGCSGACYSYDLSGEMANYPALAAFGKNPGPPGGDGRTYIIVAEGSTSTAATQVYRLPKPSLQITQPGATLFAEGTKLYADFLEPNTQTPDSQYVTLRVTTTPLTLFPNGAAGPYPAVVEWHFEDVDDPTDGDSSGGDNLGEWDGWSGLAWEQEGSYTLANAGSGDCATAIISGESRVRFHYQDRPGDNYKIMARAKIPGYGTPESPDPLWQEERNGWILAETPILTVWKRLYVEVDSFGQAPGRPLDDDAVFEDLPDPTGDGTAKTPQQLLEPLQHILAPAFVEPFHVASSSNLAIPFNDFLDYEIAVVNGTAPDDTDLLAAMNRNRGSTSYTGEWGVYLLGGYEVQDGVYYDGSNYRGYSDNDEDGETIPGADSTGYPSGMTATNCGNTNPTIGAVFVEGIRDLCAQHGCNFYHFLNSTAWHETGHQLHLPDVGSTDGSGGLMEIAGPEKNLCLPKVHLDIIRGLAYPSCTN